MDPGPWMVVCTGGFLLLLGLFGSVAPVLPGPPVSALGALVLQAGLHWGLPPSTVGWVLASLSAVLGAVLTVVELIAPAIVGKFGGSGRASAVGATIGVVVGMVLACSGGGAFTTFTAGLGLPAGAIWTVLCLLGGTFLGGYLGEYQSRAADDPDRNGASLRAATAHAVGILVGTIMKLGYGVLALVLGVGQVVAALITF